MNKTKEIVRPTARRAIIPGEKTFSSRLDRREKRFDQRESTDLRHEQGKPATAPENSEIVESLDHLGKSVECFMKAMWTLPPGEISQTNIRNAETALQTIYIVKDNVLKTDNMTFENKNSLRKECKLLFQTIMSEKHVVIDIKDNVFKAITQLNSIVVKKDKEKSAIEVER